MVGTVLVPLVAFALPLTDVGLSLLRRFLSGHSLFGADREHIHHKLLELGLTQRQAVMILYGFSAVCAVLSLSLLYSSRLLLVPVIGLLVLGLFFFLRRLGYHEFAEVQRVGQRVASQKELMARNIAVRKIAARLKRAHNINLALELLEGCLHQDFDGFEVILEPEFMEKAMQQEYQPVFVRKFWNESPHDRVIFTLGLSSPLRGAVGQISLFRNMEAELPIDADLFTRELRRAFGMALENCAQASGQPLKLLPKEPRLTEPMAVGE
jgi:hypothetical protein